MLKNMISNNTLPTVSIVFPSRNREWILSDFLKCILELDYPKNKIEIITIVNDSSDKTEQILYDFKFKYENTNKSLDDENKYRKIRVKKYNMSTPIYDEKRIGITENIINVTNGLKTKAKVKNSLDEVYKNLGKLRNSLLHNADSDYVFSVDTDIIFPPNTLKKLLSHEKDYVAGLICNGYVFAENMKQRNQELNPFDYTNIMFLDKNNDYKHIKFYEAKGLIEVDNTGAIFLISKKAYKSGANYDFHKKGEDAYMSEELKKRGFKLYCDSAMKCTHIMNKDFYERWKQGEKLW